MAMAIVFHWFASKVVVVCVCWCMSVCKHTALSPEKAWDSLSVSLHDHIMVVNTHFMDSSLRYYIVLSVEKKWTFWGDHHVWGKLILSGDFWGRGDLKETMFYILVLTLVPHHSPTTTLSVTFPTLPSHMQCKRSLNAQALPPMTALNYLLPIYHTIHYHTLLPPT